MASGKKTSSLANTAAAADAAADYDKLTRQEIIEKLSGEFGSSKEAKEFTNAFFDSLSAAVADKPKIKISQFGAFVCINKKARVGRNPRTGKSAVISARRVVKFMPSQNFRSKTVDDDID